MKAADWRTLYKIGLGICFLVSFFGLIIMLWGYSLVGIEGVVELSISALFVGGVFFLLSYISYQKFEEAEKLEYKPDPKHQQERLKK